MTPGSIRPRTRRTGRAVALATAALAMAGPAAATAQSAAASPAAPSSAQSAASTAASAVGGTAVRLTPRSHRVPAKTLDATGRAAVTAAVVPLRTFSSSFSNGGVTHRYTMVGTAPGGAAATTTVPNTLTPVTLKFATRTMAVPAATVTATTGSGLWTAKAFPGGTGQYLDVFLRTQFWSVLANGTKAWHVRLGTPTVRPVLTLTVPSGSGRVLTVNGVPTGFADINWLDAAVQSYVTAPAANLLTQLLARDVVLCDGAPLADLSNCGIGGYHSMTSTATGKHTYAYDAWLNSAIFGDPTFANIAVMTHEVAEWAADPYVDNRTPSWISPLAPQYGCNDFLEVGDPVVGQGMTVGGLFYQDEVYLNWFSRRATSDAWQGRRTWMNSITALSAACTPA